MRAIPRPKEVTYTWCKTQRTLGHSVSQMAKLQGISVRTMRRWLKEIGVVLAPAVTLMREERRKSFGQAIAYADGLREYPSGKDLERVATVTAPFTAKDLLGMVETRAYRNLGVLRKGSR